MSAESLLLKIASLGLKNHRLPDFLARKAMLSNAMAVVAILLGFSFVLFFRTAEVKGPFVVMGAGVLSLALNGFGFFTLSRWLMCIVGPTVVLYVTCAIAPPDMTLPPGRLMALAMIIMPLLLFDAREGISIYLATAYAIVCYFGFEILADYWRIGQGVELLRQTPPRIFLSIMAITLLIIGFSYLHYFNLRSEKQVAELLRVTAEQNADLKSANETLAQQREELRANNELIAEQREELQVNFEELQTTLELVEAQNRDIKDSIQYALRIQEAILPAASLLSDQPIDFFIYYRPRDIVSGDFYWFTVQPDRLAWAAVDCTGHGVPGAFMSVLGASLLNQISIAYPDAPPHLVLEKLNEGVMKNLNQKEALSQSLDGMDISLAVFDWPKRTLHFAGAQRPLWLLRQDEWIMFKGSRRSVGGKPMKEAAFETQTIGLQPGDRIYLFSDGVTDQNGGEKGRKLTPAGLQTLLFEIRNLSMAEQRAAIDTFFTDWKKGHRQLDDMLLIGVQIKETGTTAA